MRTTTKLAGVAALVAWAAIAVTRSSDPTAKAEAPDNTTHEDASPDELADWMAHHAARTFDMVAPLREAANGQRAAFLAEGWSQAIAEQAALAVFLTAMNIATEAS